jgi:hypothetical protein
MKKLIALIAIFVCVGSALSAQISMSAGGGGILDIDISSSTVKVDGKKDNDASTSGTAVSFGAMGFFDATYVEADVAVLFYNKSETIAKISYKTSSTSLMIGLLGKYPIELSGFTVFPLAGFQFFIPLSAKAKVDDGDWVSEDFDFANSRLWIKIGGGGDIDITPQIYIRPSLLWGFRFKTSDEKDELDALNKNDSVKASQFNHSFQLRVVAGFRF